MLASDKWTLVLLVAIIFGCAFVVKYFGLQENFNSDMPTDLKNTVFVVYSPSCGHCKDLEPVWGEVIKKYGSKIKSIDATNPANKEFIKDIKGYPFIGYYSETGKISEYTGERTTAAISKFVDEKTAPSSGSNWF